MSHAAVASYIKAGHPRKLSYEGGVGSTYVYIGPTATLEANEPAIGDEWADTRPVVACELIPLGIASTGLSEMIVTTGLTFGGEVIGTVLDQTFYGLDWMPVEMPLEMHPKFRASGEHDLTAVAGTGDEEHTGIEDIIGWRAELNPNLRRHYKYRRMDSYGVPGAEVTAVDAAKVFMKLSMKGIETYTEWAPVWTKRSTYRGSSAPGTDAIGEKETPSGSGYPSGYEWVKVGDSVERTGTSSKWTRDERWQGCKKVFVDKIEIYETL